MKQVIFDAITAGITSLVLGLLIIPVLIRYSGRLGLTDKPNHRKVHSTPVPVVGGLSMAVSCILAMLPSRVSVQLLEQYPLLLAGSIILFVTGTLDDRINIKPLYRLMVQFLCAYAIAASGIRISSLYGLFGVYEIGTAAQYLLTVFIITGVTNAFNLVDGIDGLAGGLALINLAVLAALSLLLQQYTMFVLLVAIAASVMAFLKSNIHPARIFMGDGGSLMLGFIMSSAGILLIETSNTIHAIDSSTVMLIVSVILVVPVFDSLRVYAGRIRRGISPFRADKTHLHHHFLVLGLNHRKAAYSIYGIEFALLLLGTFLHRFATISLCMLVVVVFFLFICHLLTVNTGVEKWTRTIRKMEEAV